MKIDMKAIVENSKAIYAIILKKKQVPFAELERQTALEDTSLCLSISWLIRNQKIRQTRKEDAVYYCLA